MRFLVLTFLLLLFTACSSTRSGQNESDTVLRAIDHNRGSNTVEVDTGTSGADLTSYLRRVSGVMVRGSGPDAMVRIRGDASILTETSPLFVINGRPMGNDFSQVYSSIDINEIARITVLKNVSDTNRYGMQGASGVIEIKLKR